MFLAVSGITMCDTISGKTQKEGSWRGKATDLSEVSDIHV